MLNYVGRYTHRVAISNNRLLDIDNGQVKFHWKDYRDNSQHQDHGPGAQRSSSVDFCSTFCPTDFSAFATMASWQTVTGERSWHSAVSFLGMPTCHPRQTSIKDYRQRYQELTGPSLTLLPTLSPGPAW